MDWFLYDNGHRHERVKSFRIILSYHDFQISKLIFNFEIFSKKKKKKIQILTFLKKKIQLSQNWQTTAKEGKMIIYSFPQNFYIILF